MQCAHAPAIAVVFRFKATIAFTVFALLVGMSYLFVWLVAIKPHVPTYAWSS
eukprot:gene2858-1400_t